MVQIINPFARVLQVFLLLTVSCFSLDNFDLDSTSFDVVVAQSKRRLARNAARELAFGDYAEYPETCPLITTCPMICVMNTTDCPTRCPVGENLCYDGTCSKEPCDEEMESPCWCDPLWTACPRPIDYYDKCIEDYGVLYDNYTICLEEYAENLPKVSYTGPWFLFCYIWIVLVTLLVFFWCFYNQKLFPVEGSTLTLIQSTSNGRGEESTEKWTQTGYKGHFIGTLINWLVWITLFGIQFLLFLLTIFYYMQQEAITMWAPVFLDAVQCLLVFQIIWMVGFVWSLSFMWPKTIGSLFRRRCRLNEATFVAVVAPIKRVDSNLPKSKLIELCHKAARIIAIPFDVTLRFYFSYPVSNLKYETSYCKVDRKTFSFSHRMGRYVYSESDGCYIPGSLELGKTIGEYLELRSGLTADQAVLHYQVVGPNVIIMEKPNILKCLYNEFSKVFYVYQTFLLWTWFNYWYYHMALISTFARLVGGIIVSVFKYRSDCTLYKLSHVEGSTDVIRDGQRCTISVEELVPGDVVVLQPGLLFCDMVVLESKHLLVDESALTGESNPVFKLPLDVNQSKSIYEEKHFKQCTLYSGTTIIENEQNGEDLGLVIATGSFTRKGQLLSEILSYQRHKFQFDDEIIPVLFILGFEAVVLCFMVYWFLGDQYVYSWFYAMFVIATIFPPLLPTVFVVSVGISAERLSKKRITCTNSEGLLVAGKVNVCCFDKTGTLTEAGMHASGVDSAGDEKLEMLTRLGMAVCHNLKVMSTGQVIGNEVDKASFEFTGATVESQQGEDFTIRHEGETYVILKQNLFDNERVTQSVIVEMPNGKKYGFTKGSAEAIRGICRSETIPPSFDDTLHKGSKDGLYLLAMGYKELDLKGMSSQEKNNIEITYSENVSMIERDDIESSLTFCGFIKFENVLKEESKQVLDDLKAGNILLTMITGDNVLTGIKIARECGICDAKTLVLGRKGPKSGIEWVNVDADEVVSKPIDVSKSCDLAITGEAWSMLLQEDPEYAKLIVRYIRVFGRCNPLHKVSVVTSLVEEGYMTLMCGDGQNDCGAIKSAHVGVALSTADASVVAPFTSLDLTLTAVTEILREGRCALSSALKVYTYYMLYGQLCSFLQTINAYFATTFNGWAWIFLDGLWPLMLSFSLPLAQSANRLFPCRPTASLFGPRTLSSMCGLLGWNLVYLVLAMFLLFQQDWFQCRKWDGWDVSGEGVQDNYETSVLYIIGGYQFVISALALCFGYTFRAAWYTNYWLIGFVIIFSALQFTMVLYPSKFSCIWRVNCSNENVVLDFAETDLLPIMNNWNTTVIPVEFRWTLVMIMIANTLTLCSWEYFFVNTFLYNVYSFGHDDPLSNKRSSDYR